MKKAFAVLVVLGSACSVPAWALYDCGRLPAIESEVVVLGVITSVQELGCRVADGSIGACPTVIDLGEPFPDRAYKVKFSVRKVLKGDVGSSVDFVVFRPDLLIGCKGPGMELYTRSLVFLHRDGGNLTAWGGDYGIYQRTRSDYGAVVKRISAILRDANVESTSAQPEH